MSRKRPLTWKEDDAMWDEAFANSQDVLAKLADEAELWYATELALSHADRYVRDLKAKAKPTR